MRAARRPQAAPVRGRSASLQWGGGTEMPRRARRSCPAGLAFSQRPSRGREVVVVAAARAEGLLSNLGCFVNCGILSASIVSSEESWMVMCQCSVENHALLSGYAAFMPSTQGFRYGGSKSL